MIDSSSLIELKQVPAAIRSTVVRHLTAMATTGGLIYPSQVLGELERYADPKTRAADIPYQWAKGCEANACHPDRLHAEAKAILDAHKDLIDPSRSSGSDPADPYLIALALKLKSDNHDARIVTDDHRQIKNKVSVAAVSGLLGVPSTVLRIFLRGEGFNYG